MHGGVEDLWMVGLVLLPWSLAVVMDACALPITVAHDVGLGCKVLLSDEPDDESPTSP